MTMNFSDNVNNAAQDAVQNEIEQMTGAGEMMQTLEGDLNALTGDVGQNLENGLNGITGDVTQNLQDVGGPVTEQLGAEMENAQGILQSLMQGIEKLVGRFFN